MVTSRVKLFSYARFSSDKQKEGDSIHRQLTLAEEYVATHPQYNFQLINQYQDDGRSAHHGKHLTVGRLGEFLKDVKDGRIEQGSWLGFEDFDRLNRQNYWDAKAVFEELINAGITVCTFKDGRIFDLQSLRKAPFEFFTALMSMVGASEYTAKMSFRSTENWKAKRELAVTTGKIMSANVPAWIDTIVVDEVSPTGRAVKQHFEFNVEKSAIVRQVCDLYLKGVGCQSLARKLNLEKVPCLRKGKYWGPANVRAILNNQALCGRYVQLVKKKAGETPVEPVIIESYYPPIVSRAVYKEIQLLLKSNNNSKLRPDPTLANPLQGLCHCSECGALMTRVSQKPYRGRRAYQKLVCIGAKSGKHKYRTIEVDHVIRHLYGLLTFPQAFNPNANDAMTPLLAKRADIELRIERLTSAIAKVGLSDALQRALRAEETSLATVDKLIETEAQKSVYGDAKRMSELSAEVRQAWKQASTDASTINGLLRRMFELDQDRYRGRRNFLRMA